MFPDTELPEYHYGYTPDWMLLLFVQATPNRIVERAS